MTGRTLDLGEMVAEELALALDPYPRAADAGALVSARLGPNISFGAAEPPETPLAALAQLQHRRARAMAGARAEVEKRWQYLKRRCRNRGATCAAPMTACAR